METFTDESCRSCSSVVGCKAAGRQPYIQSSSYIFGSWWLAAGEVAAANQKAVHEMLLIKIQSYATQKREREHNNSRGTKRGVFAVLENKVVSFEGFFQER